MNALCWCLSSLKRLTLKQLSLLVSCWVNVLIVPWIKHLIQLLSLLGRNVANLWTKPANRLWWLPVRSSLDCVSNDLLWKGLSLSNSNNGWLACLGNFVRSSSELLSNDVCCLSANRPLWSSSSLQASGNVLESVVHLLGRNNCLVRPLPCLANALSGLSYNLSHSLLLRTKRLCELWV